MRQYKSWIAALILGSTLSANAQQKNMENKTLNENIPEMIISLEKEALASTDPMAFVELSDTDVIYFDPSLETKIEGLEQLRTYYATSSGGSFRHDPPGRTSRAKHSGPHLQP